MKTNILCQLLELAYNVKLGNLKNKIEAAFLPKFLDQTGEQLLMVYDQLYSTAVSLKENNNEQYQTQYLPQLRSFFNTQFLNAQSLPDRDVQRFFLTIQQSIEHLKPGAVQKQAEPGGAPADLPQDSFQVQPKGRHEHPFLPFAFNLTYDQMVSQEERANTVWQGIGLWIDNQIILDEMVYIITSYYQTGTVAKGLWERQEGYLPKAAFDLKNPGVWASATFYGHKLPVKLLRTDTALFGQWTDYEG